MTSARAVSVPQSAVTSSAPKSELESPWANSQFWILQVIVLALYLIRLALSVALHLDATSPANEFTTIALFLVPVIFAALNYGLAGSLFTSLWVSMLAVPRVVLYVEGNNSIGAWSEVMQVFMLNVLAILVGHRVSAERTARHLAETTELAHRRTEALYRNLFDSNQSPILITDRDGCVIEANASAYRVFPNSALHGRMTHNHSVVQPRLLDVIGPDAASQVLTHLISIRTTDPAIAPPLISERVDPIAFVVDGERALFRPTATTLEGAEGIQGLQVVFEDVTAETYRHDRMEAYAAQVVLGQEEERRHLAHELHDGPVQTLIHLCRQIDAVESAILMNRADTNAVSELRTITEGTVAELRGIAKGLRPSILDDLGLTASISQMLDDAAKRNEFRTSIGVTGSERRVSQTIELALFRIAQEAISNSERHAKCATVSAGLAFEINGIRLLVSDDGVGFDLGSGTDEPHGDSFGLPGMSERAKLIGGTLRIHTALTKGTTVEVWVPAESNEPH